MPEVISKCKILILFLLISLSLSSQTICLESDKRPIVEVRINGIRRSMLIDTGSSINIIDVNQLSDLGVKKRFKMSSSYSILGKTEMWHVLELNIKLNGIDIYQFAAADLEMIVNSIESNTGIKISGILGTPAIKDLEMIINLSKNNIIINNNKNYNTK